MRKVAILISLIVVTALLNSCNLPFSANASIGPQAWVDSPLTGTTVPLAPLEVISHASDLGGIAQFELSIDGAILRTDPSPDTVSTLVTMHQTWQPPAPGTYVITVRGKNNDGIWSGSIPVTVNVTGEPRAASVSTYTPTAIVTLTASITPIPSTPTFTLSENAFCRKGPDVSFTDVTAIPKGGTVDIQGVSEGGFWYFVFWKQFNTKCWVAAHAGQANGNLFGVPILVSPPTSVPTEPPALSATPKRRP